MRRILQVLTFDVVAKAGLGFAGVLLIRFMPGSEYGRYVLAAAAANMIITAMTSTFNRIYIVGYKKLNLRHAAGSFLALQMLLMLIVAALLYPFRAAVGGLYPAVMIMAAAYCLIAFARTVYQQELRFMRFSLVELCRAGCFLGAVVCLGLYQSGNLRAWQVLTAQSATLLLAFAITFLRRAARGGWMSWAAARALLPAVFGGGYKYLFVYFLLLAVFGQLDVFILRWLTDENTVAVYGAAFRYYSLLMMTLGAVHAVLLPSIQQAAHADEFRKIFRDLRRMLYLFALAAGVGAWLAGWIMPLVDQGRYPESIAVFRILCVSAIVSFAFSPYVHILMRFEDFRYLTFLSAAVLAASALTFTVLIRHYGAPGAALATLINYACLNGMIYARARRRWLPGAAPAARPA